MLFMEILHHASQRENKEKHFTVIWRCRVVLLSTKPENVNLSVSQVIHKHPRRKET